MDDRPDVVRLVVVSAGTGNPSSTRQLSDRVAQRGLDLLEELGLQATVRVIVVEDVDT